MRILIVEDEPTLGQQLKGTLEQTGYAVEPRKWPSSPSVERSTA